MQFQDALRAQYFIRSLEKEIQEITRIFSGDLDPFVNSLCQQLDQILLPTIAYEIGQAKEKNLLKGDTSKKRYQSFFIQDGKFTSLAKQVPQKYPFLFEQIDRMILDAFLNLKKGLKRAQQEPIFPPVIAVELLVKSDKHCGKQALLFTLQNQSKWIYKPRDLKSDQLFAMFISHLHLAPPFMLISATTLPREGYGWMEFQPHLSCQSKQDIQEYYQRAGVLLAIADTLQYSDGHYENLIARGPYPIIIDGETLFQNYDFETLKEKSVLSTGLIQKVKPHGKKISYFSAFQASQKQVYQVLYPHALYERTDNLATEFHGLQENFSTNLPYIGNTFYLAQDFGHEIMNGIRYGYNQIHLYADSLLADFSWWETLRLAQIRTLKHHTVNYAFLLRRIQQPDVCQSKEKAHNLIRKKLKQTPYTAYEIEDLLNGNIPYFTHYTDGSSLYNGKGEEYTAEFSETSIDQIKRNIRENPTKKINSAEQLIKIHLGMKNHEPSPAV